jgi:hypothetical protein
MRGQVAKIILCKLILIPLTCREPEHAFVSIFPGIGVPAVALSGSSAANSVVNVGRHIWELIKSKS